MSREQIRFARECAARAGLGERVEFVERDYREIDGRADAFESVGMLEHVGLGNYGVLGAVIARTFDPEHGRGLLRFIGADDSSLGRHHFPRRRLSAEPREH